MTATLVVSPSAPVDQVEYISHREAAFICAEMKPQTLYNLCSLGEGPTVYKHGRRNVYDRAEVLAWFRNRVKPAKAPTLGAVA